MVFINLEETIRTGNLPVHFQEVEDRDVKLATEKVDEDDNIELEDLNCISVAFGSVVDAKVLEIFNVEEDLGYLSIVPCVVILVTENVEVFAVTVVPTKDIV